MKGKLSCPYRGSETPVQGRSNPRTGENADPRREEPPPRPPRKKNTRTEAFASRARARSWKNRFRKKPRLVLFPCPFLLRGSRGTFSFPLPFSFAFQTATRRLLITFGPLPIVPFLFVNEKPRNHSATGRTGKRAGSIFPRNGNRKTANIFLKKVCRFPNLIPRKLWKGASKDAIHRQ